MACLQVPRGCQCMLMSATMNADVERLQKLVLHNPVTLNLLAANGKDSGKAGPGPGSAAEIEHFSVATDRYISLPSSCPLVSGQEGISCTML